MTPTQWFVSTLCAILATAFLGMIGLLAHHVREQEKFKTGR